MWAPGVTRSPLRAEESAHTRDAVSGRFAALSDHSLAFLGPLAIKCDAYSPRRLCGRWGTSESRP